MDNAEDLVTLKLDIARNELLTANTTLAVAAVGVGFSAYITGIFGMNLDNTETIQQTKGLFAGIVVMTSLLMVLSIVVVIAYYRSQGTTHACHPTPATPCLLSYSLLYRDIS